MFSDLLVRLKLESQRKRHSRCIRFGLSLPLTYVPWVTHDLRSNYNCLPICSWLLAFILIMWSFLICRSHRPPISICMCPCICPCTYPCICPCTCLCMCPCICPLKCPWVCHWLCLCLCHLTCIGFVLVSFIYSWTRPPICVDLSSLRLPVRPCICLLGPTRFHGNRCCVIKLREMSVHSWCLLYNLCLSQTTLWPK